MPKDRWVNSSSFNHTALSPYSRSFRKASRNNSGFCLSHIEDERDWEAIRCPICLEHPHNAVLLICSSRDRGCFPFMCDTSYRHSNCLDQFHKSSTLASTSAAPRKQQSELLCPLCRGQISGLVVKEPARRFMNSKARTCSLETCKFSGNYSELRKHARLEHPLDRPSAPSPTRQSNWAMLELQRDVDDALAHQVDVENDWDGWPSWDELGDADFWSDGSFFDFSIEGMSDVEDDVTGGLPFAYSALYSSSPGSVDSHFRRVDRILRSSSSPDSVNSHFRHLDRLLRRSTSSSST